VISGKNIICFASGWDYHPTSKHHIMRKLAERNHIIWINWHASRRPKIEMGDLRLIGSKIGQIRKGAQRVSDSITVITPFQLPMPGSTWARRVNALTVRRAINNVLRHLLPRPVQIWSFAPDIQDLVGHFNEELVLYYCVDAFGEFPGYDRGLIERRERALMRCSDTVITTSEPLYETKKVVHPNVHLVEHGVDHARLSRAVTEDLPTPPDLKSLPGPLLGYIGIVGKWVDLELVADLARRRPDASIVMIGPLLTPKGPCANLPNIHWLGERDHSVLPDYLRAFDVGLIPFKHEPLTRNANPIKLFEYLAAGVPVVSSALPAVRAMPNSVWLADDGATMADCCDEAVRHNTKSDREKRSEMMTTESWDSRLKHIGDIIAPLTASGQTTPSTSSDRATRSSATTVLETETRPCVSAH